MKHLKTFELYSPPNPGTGNEIDYEVGDTVVCVKAGVPVMKPSRPNLEEGKDYKVIKLYSIPEDKFLGNKFLRVDVQNLETGEITKGWESTRFKLEMEFDADKYNM